MPMCGHICVFLQPHAHDAGLALHAQHRRKALGSDAHAR
jgi:hypothetical protein